MGFVSTQPVRGLVHLDFDSFPQLGKALIRPQEFAESPKFRGRVFTTSELKRHFGNANPYWSFTGFNIPGHCMTDFYRLFPSITGAERTIQHHLQSLNLPERYYIIGSADRAAKKECWKAGQHELAHALWYLDSHYRADQEATIAQLPERYRESVRNRILSWGIYGPEVLDDEVHAYLATDSVSKLSQRFRWHTLPTEVRECHDRMNERIVSALTRSNE